MSKSFNIWHEDYYQFDVGDSSIDAALTRNIASDTWNAALDAVLCLHGLHPDDVEAIEALKVVDK